MSRYRLFAIKTFSHLSTDHDFYIVPAFLDIPVCETKSMFYLRGALNLRRETIERIRLAQKVGSIFYFRGTGQKILVCIMLAKQPSSLVYNDLCKYLDKALRSINGNKAVISEGFQLNSKSQRYDNSFQLLCRALRRLGFTGTLYELMSYPDSHEHYRSERITDCSWIPTAKSLILPRPPRTKNLKFNFSQNSTQNSTQNSKSLVNNLSFEM